MQSSCAADIVETCVPGVDAWAVHAARTQAVAGDPPPAVAIDVSLPEAPKVSLCSYRGRRYVPRHPVARLATAAVLASALTIAIMVALPWCLESGRAATSRAVSAPRASRISELAVLQRDSLLAGACWPHSCALTERR